MKLRLQIRKFRVLQTYWDCKVPPKLTQIEQDSVISTLMKHLLNDAQRLTVLGSLAKEEPAVTPFNEGLKRETASLQKGASISWKLHTTSKRVKSPVKKVVPKHGPKLLPLLKELGVREEHIPKTLQKIDDLLDKKEGKNGDGSSSIEEPDMGRDAIELDDFESLFRVAPSTRVPEE